MTSLLPDPPLHATPPAAGSLPVPPLMPPLMPPSTSPSTSPPRIVTDAVADSTRDDTGDPVIGILSPHDSHRPYYIAGAVAAAIVLGTLLLLPFGARPGPVIPAMVTVYAVTMSLVEAMTAYLLALQFRSTGHVSLAALAGGFGFVAVMVSLQLLVFPGVFAPHGLLHGGPQASIWIWALWHAGFPLFVLAGLVLQMLGRFNAWARGGELGRALIFAGPICALGCAYVAIVDGNLLPPLIDHGSYAALHHSFCMAVIIGATILALLICAGTTRLNNLLSLWLAVALLASLADAALTLSGSVRYDFGWYAGRILSILSSSAVFCVLILELSRMYDQLVVANKVLARRAVRDGLTGAFNRGFFAEQFPREVRRACRERSPLSLLMIDADHFKTYNDLFGHQQGDQCLIAMVNAFQKQLKRPADFIARYGGEEFAIVLPRTNAAGAIGIADEFRAAMAGLNLARSDTATRRMTVSIGIAMLNPRLEMVEPDELLRRADEALYEAKRDGRNTTRLYATGSATPAFGELINLR